MKIAGVSHYANAMIPEISVGSQMERFISVSSELNIRDHLEGGPLISVGQVRPKSAVPVFTTGSLPYFSSLLWGI